MDCFDIPTQVMFADPDNYDEWLFGIAYKDEIICGCCGGVFEISDVIKMAPEHIIEPIRQYKEWTNISDAIYGGEKPWSEERELALSDAEDIEAWANSINDEV
jgi:hypothetical protein